MCIFCGGQCGGAGEFLISIGLPFLVLYFLRIKKALARLKNRIVHRDQAMPAEPLKCECCGQPRQDCRARQTPSVDLQELELLELKSQQNESTEISLETTSVDNQSNLVKGSASGVKGWLLLLCLNLTIFIPASYLYQINCVLDLFNSPRNKILLFMFKALLAYNVLTIATMLFLAIFSFYAGLRLWHVKSRAIKTAKVFLVTQLLLILVITLIRPVMTATMDTGGQVFSAILISLIPSLFQFGLWYLYLTKSSRVRNTYGAAAAKLPVLRGLSEKLTGHTGLT
ncbi:MAG: DUF2569 family protein [Desulfobaccales bacterium]